MSALLFLHLADAPSDLGPAPRTRTYTVPAEVPRDPAVSAPVRMAASVVWTIGRCAAAEVAREMLVTDEYATVCLRAATRAGLVDRHPLGRSYRYTPPAGRPHTARKSA